MTKNIALFIDGTWNDADRTVETNVHKLYQLALAHQGPHHRVDGIPVADPGCKQIVHYLEGVGTHPRWTDRLRGGVTGFGTAKRIREAYRFLSLNYDRYDDDRVYLFGFSRGAFAARALAGFVGLIGLLLRDFATAKNVEYAYQLYKKAGEEGWDPGTLQQQIRMFLGGRPGRIEPPAGQEKNLESVPPIYVHFIGVWDTVKSLGLPGQPARWTRHYDNPLLPHHISHARHALALHELRPEYEPTLWKGIESRRAGAPKSSMNPSLQQVWFPGAHADVGGGYVVADLSDLALAWMARESAIHQLRLAASTPSPAPSANVHCEALFKSPAPRDILTGWASEPQPLVDSLLLHDVTCRQMLLPRPRPRMCEAPSPSTMADEFLKWQRSRHCAGNYGAALEQADQLALRMHLGLSFRHGKVPIR